VCATPVEATCQLPEATPAECGPGSAALVHATEAYREAVQAAVEHGAAAGACRVIDAEIATTRRRLRAITERWTPRLETALRDLTQELDETERAETFRIRWVASGAERDCGPP
jgi:V/A-type H+-transporting ATPase subunit D